VKEQSLSIAFSVTQSPQQVFDAINNVRGWWTGNIEGRTDKLGETFTYRYKDFHRSNHRISELVPGQKVVWETTDASLGSFENKAEWIGTRVVFEIAKKGADTEVRFTHLGLVPSFQCYGDCSGAWGFFVGESLRSLITTGQGRLPPEEIE
jgi:hypothetical protein